MAALTSQGPGMLPLWPLLAHPAGQPFWLGCVAHVRARVADGQAAWALAQGRDPGGQGSVGEGGPGRDSCPFMGWLLSHKPKVLDPQLCPSFWFCLPISWSDL